MEPESPRKKCEMSPQDLARKLSGQMAAAYENRNYSAEDFRPFFIILDGDLNPETRKVL